MNGIGFNLASLSLLGAAAMAFIGLVVFLNIRSSWEDRYKARVAGLQRVAGIDVVDIGPDPNQLRFLGVIAALGDLVSSSGMLSKRTLEEFQHTLRIAGFKSRSALSLLVGGKILLMAGLPAIAWGITVETHRSSSMQLYVPILCAIVGLVSPDMVIRHLRKKHLKALEAGLADALDLLVICSEAGLGLEPALERVGQEIRSVHNAVAEEMIHTSQEMRVNADRRIALTNMGKRTGLEALRRLGGTMVQSMHYGTPLSEALRVLSAELRQESMNRFEAKAGRLSVLLTMPMIAFILPCVFMVAGGPAIVQVLKVYHR